LNKRSAVKLRHDPSFVRLTITDSGQGIDPAFLPFVFERFRQADATSTRTHGGLGLTAFASSEDRKRAAQMGFQTHLSKPISVQILLTTIRSLLDQSDPKH